MKKILVINWKDQKEPEWYLNFFRMCNISIIMVESGKDAECWGSPVHIDTLKKGLDMQKVKFTEVITKN